MDDDETDRAGRMEVVAIAIFIIVMIAVIVGLYLLYTDWALLFD